MGPEVHGTGAGWHGEGHTDLPGPALPQSRMLPGAGGNHRMEQQLEPAAAHAQLLRTVQEQVTSWLREAMALDCCHPQPPRSSH